MKADLSGLSPQDIESVRARIADVAVPLVCEPLEAKRKPLDSYGAQFSLPYALACCFTRGRFGIEEIEGIHSRTDFDLSQHFTSLRSLVTLTAPTESEEIQEPYTID